MKKHEWTDLEFADWTLLPSEAALLANKTGPTRLGFAVLLKFFQHAARFPLSIQEVPAAAVAYIAGQVGVPAEELLRYDWEGRAVKYHRAQIRAFLGYREPTVQDAEELAAWLSEHVLPQGHPDEHVNAAAYQRLRDLGIEPPTPDRLERVLASASSAFEERFCTETIGRFPPATLERLEALLSVGWSLRFCRLTILQLYRPMNCASSAKTPICGMVLKQRARNSSRFAKVFE